MIVAHPRPRAQDVEIVGDLGGDLVELVGDLLAAERGQPGQAQFEDGARLRVGEDVGAVLLQPVARIVDQRDQRRHVLGRPAPAHQFLARRIRVLGVADDADHLVDIGDGDGEADQHMRAVARLGEQELGAPGHHLLAEGDEGDEHVLELHRLRAAAVQRHHVGAERGLQRARSARAG